MIENDKNYDDIVNLEYKKSTKRPQMTMQERAAQFGAFTPLEGHIKAIDKCAVENDI